MGVERKNLTRSSKPKSDNMPLDTGNNKGGAEGVVKSGTSALGNAVGGITKTAGGLVGTAGRGVGDTINNTTGTKAVPMAFRASPAASKMLATPLARVPRMLA